MRGSIGRDVATYLLEVQAVDVTGDGLQFGEPAFEAQEAHSAAFEALRSEASEPLVMWPSLPRSAQPVMVPRSRARDVVVMVSVLIRCGSDAADGS